VIRALRIRTAGRWFGLTVLLAALVHVATVFLLPQLTMNRVIDRVAEASGHNQLLAVDRAGSGDFVRSDPNSVEALCAFDLLNGPVAIVLPAVADHLSVTAVSDNTVEFHRSGGDGPAPARTLIIATEEQAASIDSPSAVAPERKGIVLIRRLVRRPEDRAAAEAERAGMACSPL